MKDIQFMQASSAYRNTSDMKTNTGAASLNVSPALPGEGANSTKPDFEALIHDALDQARDASYTGEATSTQAIANKAEFHELISAVNNAELTLRTVVAVRDKMVSAYQDILKMPI